MQDAPIIFCPGSYVKGPLIRAVSGGSFNCEFRFLGFELELILVLDFLRPLKVSTWSYGESNLFVLFFWIFIGESFKSSTSKSSKSLKLLWNASYIMDTEVEGTWCLNQPSTFEGVLVLCVLLIYVKLSFWFYFMGVIDYLIWLMSVSSMKLFLICYEESFLLLRTFLLNIY